MRTVRSAARARNRPRARLACVLLLGFGVLLGITARAAADEVAANAAIEDADGDGTDEAALIDAETDAIEPEPEDAEASAVLRHELGSEWTAGSADAGERFDVGLRQRRPSRWGRLEVAIAWRRRLDEAAAATAGSSQRDELWLLATWSR